jgi:aminomuconate-semialdehyde/2-hydroxymuconate-6-semialdehyde dehydrogenase
MKIQNFINGEFKEPINKEYFDSLNPATSLKYSEIPNSSSADVEDAVIAADNAFKTWSKCTRKDRAAIMMKIANKIEEKLDEFALAESMDQGKTLLFATNVDIPRVVENFRFFASSILLDEGRTADIDGVGYSIVVKDPVGVAALISPWNLPLYLLSWKIAPCIAYGCTCVCKPSEFTSVTAWMLCSVLKEAGLPNGVVNMVFGTGPNVGSPLIHHPKVSLISFTGGKLTLIFRNCYR